MKVQVGTRSLSIYAVYVFFSLVLLAVSESVLLNANSTGGSPGKTGFLVGFPLPFLPGSPGNAGPSSVAMSSIF